MLRLASVWLLALGAGCSSRSEPPPESPPGPPAEAVESCARSAAALATALDQLAAARDVSSLAREEAPWRAGIACAELYREPACAEAWQTAFAPTADSDALARRVAAVHATCSAAYCPRLVPAPAACTAASPPRRPHEGDPVIDQLVELDRAILTLEGLDPTVASAVAARAGVFRVTTAPVERPDRAPDSPPPLVLSLDAAGELRADGAPLARADLARLLGQLASRHGHLVISASPDTPYATVVELMDQARTAGITHIAVSTNRPR